MKNSIIIFIGAFILTFSGMILLGITELIPVYEPQYAGPYYITVYPHTSTGMFFIVIGFLIMLIVGITKIVATEK